MKNWLSRWPRSLLVAGVTFLLAALAAGSLIWHLQQRDFQSRREHASLEAANHANALQRSIERTLSATYALGTLVQQGHGAVPDFDAIANKMLPHYPGASSLQLAPAGIVRHIVPLIGNEQAIGHDVLQDQTRSKAAFLARDSGKLTLDGPFNLVQGGVGAVGRLPVFLDDARGRPSFWGFTSVLIRFPATLEAAGLPDLSKQDLAWELWRSHPDTGQKQIIAASGSAVLTDPVEHTLTVPNATWTLSVAPRSGWYDAPKLSVRVALGLLFGLLLGYVAKLLVESKAHEKGLHALVTQRTAEVRAREADLNHAQSVARVGSWVLDLATNAFRGSAELARIYGASPRIPLRYDLFLQRVHAQDRAAVDRAWQLALQGAPYDMEYRILVGAETRWVHSHAELTFDADKKLSKALGTIQDITEKKRIEEELQHHVAQLEIAFMSTVELATTLAEMRDPYRAGHERRVGELAAAIGAELGLDAQRIEGLRVAGYLHDIGTFAAPAEILSKPGTLSPIELQLIHGHSQASYEVLKKVRFPWSVAEIALQHHERMDGSGYPQGLKGEAILFDARIIAVADVVEAMSSHRPYRAALGTEAALAEIGRGRASVYDPQVVDACLRLFHDKGYTLPA